jgi:hypothetical protein
MDTTTTHTQHGDDDDAPWAACEACGLLEHPEFTCDQAAELVDAAALRDRLRALGPLLWAALEDAADDRMERADGYCYDCAVSPDERCETHAEDLERADEYRRTLEELRALMGG